MDQEKPSRTCTKHLPCHHSFQPDDGVGVKGRALTRPAQTALRPHCNNVAGCEPRTGVEQLCDRVSDYGRSLFHCYPEAEENMGAVAAECESCDSHVITNRLSISVCACYNCDSCVQVIDQFEELKKLTSIEGGSKIYRKRQNK